MLDNLNEKMMSPAFQVGLTLASNDGRPTTQGGALNGLNQNLAVAQKHQKKLEEQAQLERQKRNAATMLRTRHPEYADLVQRGLMDPEEAVETAMALEMEARKAPEAMSPMGKLAADLKAGLITRDQFNQSAAGIGKTQKRDHLKAADGRYRYVDNQELVFPGVEIDSGGPGSADFETEQKLRKEYNGLDVSRNYTKIRDSYERVRASAQRGAGDTTGASDMALVFNFMKMLDPGSVVRESEFALAAQSGGYGARVQNAVSRILEGKILTPQQRLEFVRTAEAIYAETQQNLENTNERYQPIADAHKVDASRVLVQPERYEPLSPEMKKALEQYSDEELEAIANGGGRL